MSVSVILLLYDVAKPLILRCYIHSVRVTGKKSHDLGELLYFRFSVLNFKGLNLRERV